MVCDRLHIDRRQKTSDFQSRIFSRRNDQRFINFRQSVHRHGPCKTLRKQQYASQHRRPDNQSQSSPVALQSIGYAVFFQYRQFTVDFFCEILCTFEILLRYVPEQYAIRTAKTFSRDFFFRAPVDKPCGIAFHPNQQTSGFKFAHTSSHLSFPCHNSVRRLSICPAAAEYNVRQQDVNPG